MRREIDKIVPLLRLFPLSIITLAKFFISSPSLPIFFHFQRYYSLLLRTKKNLFFYLSTDTILLKHCVALGVSSSEAPRFLLYTIFFEWLDGYRSENSWQERK